MPVNGKKHRNRLCEVSDNEIMTIFLLFHFGTFKNFEHYYPHYIGVNLRKEFPKQLSYNRFVEIEHRVFVPMMFFLKTVCFGKCIGITFIDSTPVRACNNKRIKRNKVFDGIAQTGKSTMRSVIEIINDELKNICEVEHTRHRAMHKFIMNLTRSLQLIVFSTKSRLFNLIWSSHQDSSHCFTEGND